MLRSFPTYLLHGNRFYGIEHTSENLPDGKAGGKEVFYMASLKKKKKEVDREVFFETKDVADLAEKNPPNSAFFLVLNNEQVLTKKIESPQKEDLRLINQAFPNIDDHEFYYEILSSEQVHFISICRKKHVDELIERYKTMKLYVFGFSLGNNIVSVLGPYMDGKALSTSNARIKFEGNHISAIEKTENPSIETYDINSLEVDNRHLLSFSGALAMVLGHSGLKANFANEIHANQEDYKHVRFFNLFSKSALVFLLTVLLVNFLFFNRYYNEVNQLLQTTQVNRTAKEKIMALDNELDKTQTTVSDILKSNSSKSSFYMNSIVQSLPSSILLKTLNFQPLEKRIKEDEAIENLENTILVAGKSTDSKLFSQWISEMEAKKWVQKAEILDYADISKSSSSFVIKLNIK